MWFLNLIFKVEEGIIGMTFYNFILENENWYCGGGGNFGIK